MMGVKIISVSLLCVSAVFGGIKIPRDDCEWRAGGEGDMANRCDGDQLVVGACGSGFNGDCPGIHLPFSRKAVFQNLGQIALT